MMNNQLILDSLTSVLKHADLSVTDNVILVLASPNNLNIIPIQAGPGTLAQASVLLAHMSVQASLGLGVQSAIAPNTEGAAAPVPGSPAPVEAAPAPADAPVVIDTYVQGRVDPSATSVAVGAITKDVETTAQTAANEVAAAETAAATEIDKII